MQYTNLGKTGLKVSRLCLGMMTYGSKKWRDWVLDEEQAKPFVKRALDAGINFFDTADVYSLGESEKITGNLLRHFGVKRENVIVATKVHGQMSNDVNDADSPASTSWTRLTTRSNACKWITWTCTRSTAGMTTPPSKKRWKR
jgi:aryl-alcohol dehydrogenase-like predicted oxidoreductase